MNNNSSELSACAAAKEALRVLLRESPRTFSLNLAICNDPRLQSRLLEELREEFDDVPCVSLERCDGDVFEYVHNSVPAGPHDALFVVDIEEGLLSESGRAAFMDALNISPRRWKAWYPYPIVFWLNSALAETLVRAAPDFWEWQKHLYTFDAAAPDKN